MIVASDISIHFQFSVGKKYVMVRIDFKHGEDTEDVLRAFFVQEDIPVYLEIPILSSIEQFLEDPRLLMEDSNRIVQVHVMKENALQLAEWYNTTWKTYRKEKSIVIDMTPFEREYHRICNKSIEDCERIVQFQLKQKKVVDKLITQRKEEKDSMHANQSDEMNKATVTNHTTISLLVEKHMKELEDLEQKYTQKLFSLNQRQTVACKDYVMRYNSIDHSLESVEPEEEEEDPGAQKWHRKWFKLRDQASEEPSEKIEKKQKSLAGFESSVTVSLGNRNPVLYNFELHTAFSNDFIKVTQQDSKSLIRASRSLFSNSISALVVCVNPSLSYTGRSEASLLDLSERSTDPIFDSLTQQIDRAKKETIEKGKKLEKGDCFLTEHSNLGQFQVLFHFMAEDARSPNFVVQSIPLPSDSSLLLGLRNVFEVIFKYDITSITIPLLLCEDFPDHLRTHPFCITRAISVLKALRSLLLCSSDNTLKTIRLLLPSMSIEIFEKYKAALNNVFASM